MVSTRADLYRKLVLCLVLFLLFAEQSDRTAPTFTSCPGNIGNYYTSSTSTTVYVSWTRPTATDNAGTPSVSISSGRGPTHFSPGSHTTIYTARDPAGNTATCSVTFSVVVILCPSTPSNPAHGSVGCSNSRSVGSRCTYACSTGYRLVGGSSVRTCTRRGNSASWSGSAPRCEVVTCGALTNPANGRVTCSSGHSYNSRCTFTCNSGYSLRGTGSLVCQASGSWSASAPTCADTTNPAFRSCPSSFTTYASNLATSATVRWPAVTVSDNSGATITPRQTTGRGSGNSFSEGVHPITYTAADPAGNTATCSFSITVAVIRCSALSAVEPLRVSCPNGRIRGSTCSYSCGTGYRLQGRGSTACSKTGTTGSWTNPAPTCQILQCPAPNVPANGRVVGSCSRNYGSTCNYACNTGYAINNSQRRCTAKRGSTTASWQGAAPVCTRKHCTKPHLTPALSISTTGACPAGNVVPTGNRCSFSCSAGYYMQGASVLTCQHDRTWSGNPPTCHHTTQPELTCPGDKTFVAGERSTSAPIPWDSWEPVTGRDRGAPLPATLDTIDGVAVGPVKPATLQEGSHRVVYTSTDPAGNSASCAFNIRIQVSRCPPLPVPHHGVTALTPGNGRCDGAALFGSSCRVTCEVGHTLSTGAASSTRRCERASPTTLAGFWSGQFEVCNVNNCTLPAVTHGSATNCQPPKVPYQTACVFACDDGYTTPSRVESLRRTCQADGSWSGSDLHCTVVKTCPAEMRIPFGEVMPQQCSTASAVPFGTSCEFSCGRGFQLRGPALLACSTEGEWNHSERPYCQDVEAPAFDVPCPHHIRVDAERGGLQAHVDFQQPVASDNSGQVNVTRVNGILPPDNIFQEGETRISYLATDATGLETRCNVVVTVQVHRCGFQQPLPHGSVVGCQDPYVGSRCNFACDIGHDLVGPAMVSCDLSPDTRPVWSDARPVCQVRTCPPLPVQPPATVSGCGRPGVPAPYNTLCTFHCPPGYQGVGPNVTRCKADGVWFSTNFICQRKACPPLVETAQITIAPASCLNDSRYEDVCNLQCRTPGFEIEPAQLSETVCSASQTWTKDVSQAICADVEPPTFSECPGDIVAYADRSSNQTNVQWQLEASDNSGIRPAVTCDRQPGVMTSGRNEVTCTAEDDAEKRVTCQFDVIIRVRRCPELQPPMFGTLAGSCDTSFGSVCHVTCLVGYFLVGSSEASCEFDGTDMHWEVQEEPHCEVIGCEPLVIHPSVVVSPEECTMADRVHAGTVCTVHCDNDLTLSPDTGSLTCLQSGMWEGGVEPDSLLCSDLHAPVITSCPTQEIVATRTEFWGAEVTFDFPTASDNIDRDLQVWTSPPDLRSPYNFTSDTRCTVSFQDASNNSASCIFQVKLISEVPPRVEFCPPDQNITTTTKLTEVRWDLPIFTPLPGTDMIETCNQAKNPALLPWGKHTILYQASEKQSGLKAVCRITVAITPVPCHELNVPANGALACDDGFAYGRYCTMTCNSAYDIPRMRSSLAPQKLFICGMSGVWYPHARVPDCSKVKRPHRLNLPLSIMYYGGDCTSDYEQTHTEISQKFLDIIKQTDFADICTRNKLCTPEHIHITCGAGKTRRRRDIDGEMVWPDDSKEGNTTILSMILTVPQGNNEVVENEKVERQRLRELSHHLGRGIESLIKGVGGRRDDWQSTTPSYSLLLEELFVDCEDGYIPNHDQLTCVACPTGHYFKQESGECLECEMGSYQDEQAQSQCKPCVDGTWTRETGARAVSDCEFQCEKGYYSASGFAPCIPCEEGQYQPFRGQTGCLSCPAGNTSIPGAISSQDCREPV
ncbi:complement receptor type 1-like [Diadema antillarum]|uniref:complement receptor type 1-like n=1 Tax=Diadema antillarum TaxID=105358 RepID=UPI003A849898